MSKRKYFILTAILVFVLAISNSFYFYAFSNKDLSGNEWKTFQKKINYNSLTEEQRKKYIRQKLELIIKRRKIKIESESKKDELVEKVSNKLKQKKANLNLNSKSNKKIYPNELDISSKMKYKRIQERSLSCELSAVSDIISYFENTKYEESYIIDLMDKDFYNKYPVKKGDKIIWWNPNAWYVWFIDKLPNWEKATQTLMTWYWILERPINKLYKWFWYVTRVITNRDYNHNYSKKNHLREILEAVNNGHMVQMRWDYCTDPRYEDTSLKNTCINFGDDRKMTWYYKDGENLVKHEWMIGEHAFYLLWYKWGIDNPTHIIVWDTNTWKHAYNIKEWMRKRDRMQNRTVIIYNK